MGFWAAANVKNEKDNATTYGGMNGAGGALEDLTRKRLGDLGKNGLFHLGQCRAVAGKNC